VDAALIAVLTFDWVNPRTPFIHNWTVAVKVGECCQPISMSNHSSVGIAVEEYGEPLPFPLIPFHAN